MILILYLNNTC